MALRLSTVSNGIVVGNFGKNKTSFCLRLLQSKKTEIFSDRVGRKLRESFKRLAFGPLKWHLLSVIVRKVFSHTRTNCERFLRVARNAFAS